MPPFFCLFHGQNVLTHEHCVLAHQCNLQGVESPFLLKLYAYHPLLMGRNSVSQDGDKGISLT
jgi:hypothetical protein